MMRKATFETPGPLRLSLELPVGRIDVETVAGTTTHVELEAVTRDMEELVEEARIELRDRGDGHEVVVEMSSRFSFILFGRSQDARLRITCPHGADLDVSTKSADLVARGTYGEVEMKTASGDADIDEARGDISFKSASGDLHVNHAGASMHAQTASGDVAVDEVDGDLSVQLVSGDVWVRDARASVSANTVSGDQRLDAVSSGTMDLRAVSGDMLIGVRRGSRVYVDVRTVSGSTSSELDLSDAPQGEEEENVEGSQLEIRAKTVSGDVAIIRAPAAAKQPAS